MMWGDQGFDIQPAPLKRECASCGISANVDEYSLCTGCREDWDDEMTAILNRDRDDDDRAATRRFYNG